MRRWFVLAFALLAGCGNSGSARRELLHVSYDPTRELFEDVNRAFVTSWAREHGGEEVEIQMSHGGSGSQARAVIDGLDADVVSLALAYDIDAIAREGQRIASGWRDRLPHGSAPWTSTIVFVVRRGNPKQIRDWNDLVERDGVQVITPNPKTSGGARWAYLAAYGYALRRPGGSAQAADDFMRRLFARVPVLDTGARGASTTFARNRIGDVLLTWENEARLLREEYARDGLEVVIPSTSIEAVPPVAWVDRNVERHRNGALAQAYLRYLYTPETQELVARHHYRPSDEAVLERHRGDYPELELFTVEDVFGGWERAHREHFADGAKFDRIQAARAR